MRTEEGLSAVSAAGIWVDRNVGEDWLVVDLRGAEQFDAAHVPGAVSAPWPEVATYELRLKVYARGRRIACVVPDERLAGAAQRTLSAMGLGDVRVLEGGVESWAALGFPLERTEPAVDAQEGSVSLLAGGLILSGLVMSALVSPGFLMVSGLGWAFCGGRSREVASARSLAFGR